MKSVKGPTSTVGNQKSFDHTERAHALLSPSGAHRWLNCTPSARLEEQYGERTTSVYADEGTLAHEIGDLIITRDILNDIQEDAFEQKLDTLLNHKLFKDEMLDYVDTYVQYCNEQFAEAKTVTADAKLYNERRVNLSRWIEDSYGSTDCSIIADGVLEVIDLKYGKGVSVSAVANKQLMLYGLGSYHEFEMLYDIHTVRLTIVQPRLDSISSWEISVEELLTWAETDLIPNAKKAFAGEGDVKAGDWCKFCSIKNRCSELAKVNLDIAKHEFKAPVLLTDDEIASIIKQASLIIEWVNSVTKYALISALENGKHWPGYKVVEGISRRKWLDEELVAQTLFEKEHTLSEEDIYKTKLKSITDLEKLLGKKKFAELLSSLVIKPQGKPALVSELDKRQAITGAAKYDFSEE